MMSLQDEIAAMTTAIEKLVTATLSNIRKNLSGNNDFVLVDRHENFKGYFLSTAKSE